MSNTELKPCPFCGADDPEIVEEIDLMLKQYIPLYAVPVAVQVLVDTFAKM